MAYFQGPPRNLLSDRLFDLLEFWHFLGKANITQGTFNSADVSNSFDVILLFWGQVRVCFLVEERGALDLELFGGVGGYMRETCTVWQIGVFTWKLCTSWSTMGRFRHFSHNKNKESVE